MIDRVRSKPIRGKNGGRREGAGRRFGSTTEAKKVARAQAAKCDLLPHELLLEWGRTGYMRYVDGRGKKTVVELGPSDRISCAKGCAAWYKAPYQSRPAPGEQPPIVHLELDPKMVAALAKDSPDKLDVLRDVLRAVQAGGAALASIEAQGNWQADATRYGRMLSESSEVAG